MDRTQALGPRAQRQQERKALLDTPMDPVLCETYLYTEMKDGAFHYHPRMDFKTVYTKGELLSYLMDVQKSADDGWNVCLFIEGEPCVRIRGKEGVDPWK